MAREAVILAGGRSSRMGRDKAGLTLGGEDFLTRLVTRFRGSFDRVWVSGRWELPDLRPGQGPLAGLETAFVRTGAERLFLTAVDLPFGDPALALELERRMGDADACLIQREDRRWEPLFALYARTCLPALSVALDRGERSFYRGLIPFVTVREVAENSLSAFPLDRLLFNTNTLEEWYRAIDILR